MVTQNKQLNGLKKLTPKQERFCQEYLVDLNATAAAIRSGYSRKVAKGQASENLTKPNIQDHLRELLRPHEERLHEDVKNCLEKLQTWVDRSDDKNPTASQLKAVELLLKYHGMLIDRSERQETQTINIQINVDKDTQQAMEAGIEEMLGGRN